MNIKDNLNWYYKRFTLMSPAEITYRINNKYKTAKERIFHKNKSRKTVQIKNFNNFLFESSDLEHIKSFYDNNPEYKDFLFNKADKILEHKFSFFNLKDKYLGEKINWHKDYLSGKTCEPAFYEDIDYKDYKKNGDIKYIWDRTLGSQFLFKSICRA